MLFLRQMYCRLELKWSQAKSIHKVSFVLCVVDDVVKLGGGASERVQIFILAEGQKNWQYQVDKAVWCNLL